MYSETIMSEIERSFDYLVVGGGSAGCVLAERLAENGQHTVCLIEAGGSDWNPLYKMTFLAGQLYRWKLNNWNYHTVPQSSLRGREIFLPRGRMLGGSFNFNGAVYIRGQKQDYDAWRDQGNEGWSYDEVLPYFKRTEIYSHGANAYHGGQGGLSVGRSMPLNPLTQAFIQAGLQAGHVLNDDFNGAHQEGIGAYDHNIGNGYRCTTARSLLKNTQNKSNFVLFRNTKVLKIEMEQGVATGVRARHGPQELHLKANREIVLCGGAVNTPQILLLSGIGPGKELAEHGIKVEQDLAGVGKNLMDHLNVTLGFQSVQPVSIVGQLRADRIILNTLRGVLGTGPFSRSVIEGGCFFKSSPEVETPDIQVAFTPIFGPVARVWYPWMDLSKNPMQGHSFGVCFWPNRPQSRGSIQLKSAHHQDSPLIDPAYLTAESDLVATRKAFKLMRKLVSMKALDAYRGIELAPGVSTFSDDEIDLWIRQTGNSGHHLCGSARMGIDNLAVVDPKLRVHGVGKLRIADTSVMPCIDSGNTNAPAIMIAEKAASYILDDARSAH